MELSKLYLRDTIKSYQGRSLGTMPPHVFAIGTLYVIQISSQTAVQSMTLSISDILLLLFDEALISLNLIKNNLYNLNKFTPNRHFGSWADVISIFDAAW